jgi:redox-sensing transcriptional repressor
MSTRLPVPRPTVKRLSLYLRELDQLALGQQSTVSSRQLGEALGVTDAQVRKDFAYFGQFGHPGVGYRVDELIDRLRRILGTDRSWNAVVVGAGNIGRAIMSYGRFGRTGFAMVAVFDDDASVVGSSVAGHVVRPVSDLPRVVRDRDVKIGVIAVPAEAAQSVADALIRTGVQGILNFAPVRLDAQDRVSIVSVHLSVALEQLAFQISLGQAAPGSAEAT